MLVPHKDEVRKMRPTRDQIATMRRWTLGSYWPYKASIRRVPNWSGIALELRGHADDSVWRGDDDEAAGLTELATIAEGCIVQ